VAGVSAVALIMTAPGQTILVSQLNAPLTAELGLSAIAVNSSYMIATVVAALPLVYVGAMTDRLGPRRMLAITALLFALGCVAMALAQGLATVLIGFFLLRFLGQGALAMVAQHALAMWFHRRLGSIQGIKSVLIFSAWIPLPLLTTALIAGVGWRWTWVIFGATIAATVIPLALRFVHDRPEDIGLRLDGDRDAERIGEELPEATGAGPYPGLPDDDDDDDGEGHDDADDRGADKSDRSAAVPRSIPAHANDWTLAEVRRTATFWIITSAFFLSPLVGTALIFDMQAMLEANGGSAFASAMPLSVWTAVMAVMAIPAGILTDRVRVSILVSIGMALVALSPLVLWIHAEPLMAAVAMAVFAIGQTLVAASGSAAVARFYGRAHHGAIRATIARIGVFGTGLGPLVTGGSVYLTGGYSVALVALAVICIPVVVASIRLAPPQRRMDASPPTTTREPERRVD